MDNRICEERYEDDKYGQGIWAHVKILHINGWKYLGMGRATTKEEALQQAINDAEGLISKIPAPDELEQPVNG